MNIQGKIKLIGQTEEIGTKGFTKRTLVVETLETYPQTIPIEFVKERTGLLDNLFEGQDVNVHVNVRGQEYNGKYYVSLNGWKIE